MKNKPLQKTKMRKSFSIFLVMIMTVLPVVSADPVMLQKTMNVKAEEESAHEILVTWTSVDSAEGYHVYRSYTAGNNFEKIGTVENTEFRDRELTPATTYYYKVAAYADDQNGEMSDPSAATTKRVLSAPDNLDARGRSSTEIYLSWDPMLASNADKYNIYRSESESGEYILINDKNFDEKHTDSGLTPEKVYYYKVSGVNNSYGEGPKSLFAKAQTFIKPVTRADTLSENTIRVSWKKIPNVEGYNIYRSNIENGEYTCIKGITGEETLSYTDEGLSPGTTYYYKVSAVYSYNEDKNSDPASATTKTPEKSTNPGNGDTGGAKTGSGSSGELITPGLGIIPEEEIQQDEIKKGTGGFVFPLFLLLVVLTAGVLYVRAKRRAKGLP